MHPGARIKDLRRARGLTQEQLAGQRLTKSFISQVEKQTATPSLASLETIAENLNVPLSLLCLDGSETLVGFHHLCAYALAQIGEQELAGAHYQAAQAFPHAIERLANGARLNLSTYRETKPGPSPSLSPNEPPGAEAVTPLLLYACLRLGAFTPYPEANRAQTVRLLIERATSCLLAGKDLEALGWALRAAITAEQIKA